MIIIATFEDFVSNVVNLNEKNPNWRAGQTAFNLLAHIRPDISELIRGSEIDPFHNDSRLSVFYDFVYRHWGV